MELSHTIFQRWLCPISLIHASILLTCIPSLLAQPSPPTDQLSLLSFRSLLSDPLRSLSSWNNKTNSHFCRWQGVACNDRKNPERVTSLDLDFQNLTGSISPSLANLTFLNRLHLAGNLLHGQIPQDLGRLSHLRYLNLSYNSLDGEIPLTLSHLSGLHNISLNANKLHGEIPPSLSDCSDLRVLCLDDNLLTGEIPDTFGSLRNLSRLYLSTNNLAGVIPAWLGRSSSLTLIDLSENSFMGTIPSSLGNLSSLYVLNLSGNNLTGGIPPSLGNCSSLAHLDICENSLDGSIPESLGNLRSLKHIDVSFNELSGMFPSFLSNLSSIDFLSIGMNQFFGKLPPDFGHALLPRLQYLVLQGNEFEGPIPLSLPNASAIEVLDLSNNQFSGSVPSNLGGLSELYHLNLGWNRLQGWSFLSSLTNCTNLGFLILSNNPLGGRLPRSIANLSTQLEWLSLTNNQISGSIPAEIENLVSLTSLVLNQNLIMGTIPSTIGKLSNLNVLDLSGNKLFGQIPDSLGNLAELTDLRLGENGLQGSIPTSFGKYTNLGVLNLSYNQLSGSIPKEVVTISSLSILLDLSHNSLVGSLPLEVGKLKNLIKLDVSYNKLSGEIPTSLGDCDILQFLYMEENYFQGSIPSYLSHLKGIQELDLSHNNLSGHIPESLARISTLQYLNLSFNDFEGEVPMEGVFTNMSAVFIRGNNKLCGGDPQFQLEPCAIEAKKGDRNFPTLEVIIPIIAVVICLILFPLLATLYRKRKRRKIASSMFPLGDQYMRVSYTKLHKATDGFSQTNLIGVGSFGSVYRGTIDGYEKDVAVKVLNLNRKGASKSFMSECEALRNIRHRNLISIVTSCSSIDSQGNDFKALVYEIMSNGSLEEWLHPRVSDPPRNLSLLQRLNIAIDVACALEYLHHNCQTPMVHCDLKPSNVLLDDEMNAHVGDFGLARFLRGNICMTSENANYSLAIKGSIGYVAPEYGMGDKVSVHGDVYSFGILLLEILTGKRPTDDMFKDDLALRKFVEMAFPERVTEIVDPQILVREENSSVARERMQECLVSMIRIGLSCSKEEPNARMEMKNVAVEMHAIRTSYLGSEKLVELL